MFFKRVVLVGLEKDIAMGFDKKNQGNCKRQLIVFPSFDRTDTVVSNQILPICLLRITILRNNRGINAEEKYPTRKRS